MSDNNTLRRTMNADTAAAFFFAVFAAVYESFSHGVSSLYMIGAFLIPLTAGTLPLLILRKMGRTVPQAALLLWHMGLAALTVGAVFQGALEIYGTTNRMTAVYPAAGLLLMLSAAAVLLRHGGKAGSPRD